MGCLTCGAARARRLRAGLKAGTTLPRLKPQVKQPAEQKPESSKPVSGEVPATPTEPEVK